ncbi:hypothetical protein Nepgr_027864 [Nepenthes gracilis]|uniref:Thioredoxin domain-containing protein n=1 Tax=Nepenthes gracilis TaxID=150966 RepID=A0AAD3TBA5_NEPGR|nr:hypothetical protein Nepgr_027864 [Nepenthes gracilis]
MARYCAVRSPFLRSLLRQQHVSPYSFRALSTFASRAKALSSPPPLAPSTPVSTSTTHASSLFSPYRLLPYRKLSSDTDVPSNIVLIRSEEDLNDAFRKAEDESLPAIFYFTAEWCGPCRFLWPSLKNLSKDLSHITIYKIDIDQEDLNRAIEKLNIFSVPTLQFFWKGKKANEIVGADVEKIKNVSFQLYES